MKTRVIYLTALVLALSLVGHVQAVSFIDTGDQLWSNPDNWDTGVLPTASDWVKISQASDLAESVIISDGFDAVADRVHIGYQGEDKTLSVDGGTLVISGDDLRVGKECTGILNMISGSIDIARDLDICDNGGTGLVNMSGGTINISDDLELPNVADATGTLNMTGGTINIADDFDMLEPGSTIVHLNGGTINVGDDLQLDDPGEFDITAGTLIVDGNAVTTVQGYIDANVITSYGGPYGVNGVLLVDYNAVNDQTMVKAVHKLDPYPVDGGIVPPGQVELSWTLPDPCTPGQPVRVDVYLTDDYDVLKQFSDPAAIAAIQLVSEQNVASVVAQVQPKIRYYWAVDVYLGGDDPNDNPRLGPIFSFLADNMPPEVLAGKDVLTWLDNGSADVVLAGAVIDADPTSTVWTVVSEPNDPNSPDAVIADAAALDTTITLSALGEYVLQLQADDGEYQGTDTLTINVYSDHCAAAKSQPGWQPLPGDINLDCVVDQTDLDLLLEQWLNCNGLDCPDIDPIDPNVP